MKKTKKFIVGVLTVLMLVVGFTACFDIGSIGKTSDVENSSMKESVSVEESSGGESSDYQVPVASSEGLEYKLNDDKQSFSVVGIGVCEDTDIVIPSTYYNFPVTMIASRAFYNNQNLTSVVIPDSVTSIGSSTFHFCVKLVDIVIGDGVTSIGGSAFSNTGYVADESNWENGILYIGKYLIDAKEDIFGSYIIKDGTLCIGTEAFYFCSDLVSVVIPDSVTNIGGGAFSYCRNLISITISNSVTSIGNYMFWADSSLIIITFNGTTEQWNTIEKGDSWNYNVPATEVICNDGKVTLN